MVSDETRPNTQKPSWTTVNFLLAYEDTIISSSEDKSIRQWSLDEVLRPPQPTASSPVVWPIILGGASLLLSLLAFNLEWRSYPPDISPGSEPHNLVRSHRSRARRCPRWRLGGRRDLVPAPALAEQDAARPRSGCGPHGGRSLMGGPHARQAAGPLEVP